MKIRQGFVSNSSSSSYIIGIAKVDDIKKCKKYIEDNKIDADDINISTYKDLKETKSWTVTIRGDKSVEVESFDGNIVSIDARDFKDGTFILTYCFFGNEGDHVFYEREDGDDDWCEPNYDKVYNDGFFDKTEEDVMTMLGTDTSGLGECNFAIGASRNG